MISHGFKRIGFNLGHTIAFKIAYHTYNLRQDELNDVTLLRQAVLYGSNRKIMFPKWWLFKFVREVNVSVIYGSKGPPSLVL